MTIKRLIPFILGLLLIAIDVGGQTNRTKFKTGIYTSYFALDSKQPLYVVYHLFQGGGPCDRDQFDFQTATGTANDNDYKHSNYEKGHLAPAEDFAGDCVKEEITFFYYNALPQTLQLNRGTWKSWEIRLRNESQTKHLLIVCGGIYKTKTTINNKLIVPNSCWKIVYDESDGKMLYCLSFPNDRSGTGGFETSLKDLKKSLGYRLTYKKH